MRYLLRTTWQCAMALAFISLICPPPGHAAESTDEPLPATFFENLQAKKKQTAIVYGTSLTHKGAWTRELAKYFEEHFPDQVTFINAAKSGRTSDWGAKNLQEQVLSKNPDLVMIEFSINDAATKHSIPVEKSVANLDEMVQALRKQNPKVDIVLQTMNPAWDSPENPEKTYGRDRPNLEVYYDAYREYARQNTLPLVDHYPNWVKMQKEEPERFQRAVSDGIHPHSGPSREITAPAVEALLEKARAAALAH